MITDHLMNNFSIKSCDEKQVPAIMEIFNDAILNSTALYDYKIRTFETVHAWYIHKKSSNYPVIGLFDDQDTLLGFATYGPFRERPAYKYTVEHSVYVHPNERGKGYGTILLREIVKKAEEQDYHIIVGGIDASNIISRKLHEKEGFTFCGLIQQSGYKFRRWLDLAFYQLILKTPLHPKED
jgi:phosphinothricin acetyltransferase